MAIGITLAVTQSAPIDNPGNNTSLNNNVSFFSLCVLSMQKKVIQAIVWKGVHVLNQSFPSLRLSSNITLHEQVTCLASQCVLTASHIINDMDPTVDPCQDFSKFTCMSPDFSYPPLCRREDDHDENQVNKNV